jgi:hypothetical protein
MLNYLNGIVYFAKMRFDEFVEDSVANELQHYILLDNLSSSKANGLQNCVRIFWFSLHFPSQWELPQLAASFIFEEMSPWHQTCKRRAKHFFDLCSRNLVIAGSC